MKKLIISEVISVILTLGVFLLVFSHFNGWEKTGQGRNLVAIMATLVGIAAGAFWVTAVVAGATMAAGAFTSVAIAAIDGMFIFAVILAIIGVGGGVAIILLTTAKKEAWGINTTKKVIWLSLGVEAVVIILPILLITFC